MNNQIEMGTIQMDSELIPRTKQGKVLWNRIPDEHRVALIEKATEPILGAQNNGHRKLGKSEDGLRWAAQHYYPGGLRGLRAHFNLYTRALKNYWSDETVREKAIEFMNENGGQINYVLLRQAKRLDLDGAIKRMYAGGISQLKEDLGLRVTKKTNGYWTSEEIERQAREFTELHGALTERTLTDAKRIDLLRATDKYPGRMRGLKAKLGIESISIPGSWTVERIEMEAQKFLQENGDLSYTSCQSNGRHDLLNAISKYYPGRMNAMRLKFGLPEKIRVKTVRQPANTWTPENIEKRLSDLLKEKGFLAMPSVDWFKVNGFNGLLNAIHRRYPGGANALREKLGLSHSEIPTGFANEQLRILLEE